MLDFDKTVERYDLADEMFFAGANSATGFVNLYGDIFSERTLDSLYIIKGGPGTGKSTFMRSILKGARITSAYTCAYLCGSDPLSLDAVTLTKGKKTIAVIDGTSPHAYDAQYPGAVAEILDTGAFLDRSVLERERERIVSLSDAKKEGYSRAYGYLKALRSLRADLRLFTDKATDMDKAKSAAKRLAECFSSGRASFAPVIDRKVYTGNTMRGRCVIDLCPTEKTIGVLDAEWSFPIFIRFLSQALFSRGISHTVLVDNVDLECLRGVLIPSSGVYVIPFSEKKDGVIKNVNMRRFVSSEKLKDSRNKRSFIKKCARSMEDGANDALSDAARNHFLLEDIHKNAMDFDSLSAASEKWVSEILSRLN